MDPQFVVTTVGATLFVVVAIVVALVVIAYLSYRSAEWRRAFLPLARQYGGELEWAGLLAIRRGVTFQHRGYPIAADVYPAGNGHPLSGKRDSLYFIELRAVWPERQTRCEVYADNVLSRLGRFLGMQDIEIGSQQFDADYVIHGRDPEHARRLLSPGVQSAIESVRRCCHDSDFYLNVCQGVLLIKKRLLGPRSEDLMAFTSQSLLLFDEALAATAKGGRGIEIFELSEAKPINLNASNCLICGEPIRDRVVYCRACRTPHHHDCWVYYGACSTYGCHCREFTTPRKKREV